MSIVRSFVALAVLAATLSGCQSPQASQPNSESSFSAQPTPTATQARETGLVAPARPFGGDCAALMSDSEASSVLGSAATLATSRETYAPEYSAELYGGLRCRWDVADGSYSAALGVILLPEGVVSYDATASCHEAIEDDAYPGCGIEDVVNGIRVSGALWVAGDSSGPAQAAFDSFMALFAERANAAEAVPVPIAAVGAWAHPVDCAAVVETADLSAVNGLGADSVGMDFPFGSHLYAMPAENALENGSAELPYCYIEGAEANVTFVALGGARWLEASEMAAAVPFAIDGYESAYTSPGQVGLTKVDIFDGPNWLHFEVKYTSNAKALADALFAALDATAAK